MYIVADRYGMDNLERRAMSEYRRWLYREGNDVWYASVEVLETMEMQERVADGTRRVVVEYAKEKLGELGAGKRAETFVRAYPWVAREILGSHGHGYGYGCRLGDRMEEWVVGQ